MLNLREGKGALTPGGKDIGKDDRDIDCEPEYSDAKLVQAAAGLEQYVALDGPDIAYSVKTALQQMSKPTKLMQLRVMRDAPYLKNNPRQIWKFPYQQQPKSIDVFRGCRLCSQRDPVEVHVWSCGVPQEIANRVWVQHAERASTVHG